MLFPVSVQGPQVVPLSVSIKIGGLKTQNSISETRHGIHDFRLAPYYPDRRLQLVFRRYWLKVSTPARSTSIR